MTDPQTIEKVAQIAERFGWPIVALAVLLFLAVRCGRAMIRGACYVWARVEPPILGILGSHQDLMDTAKEQMPRQTAILQELSTGQREHSALLSSIHISVRELRGSDASITCRAEDPRGSGLEIELHPPQSGDHTTQA